MAIVYMDGGANVAAPGVEFVGGPRSGERATIVDPPSDLPEKAGNYVRSVRCANDGALRYVWRPRRSRS